MKFSIIILISMLLTLDVISKDISGMSSGNNVYILKLTNGDIFTGQIVEVNNHEKGNSIKFKTILGSPVIYDYEISEIYLKEDYNKTNHRHFFMPTANPISNNHFIGLAELLMVYGGFGISDYISVIGCRSLIPTAGEGNQISILDLKASVYNEKWESMAGEMYIGLGANYTLINDRNRIANYFLNVTFSGERTALTAIVYTKNGGEDFFTARFNNELVDIKYENGSFGIGIGITTKFSEWHNFSFVGELWQSNLNKISNTAILAGLRLGNSKFTADFGFIFFTQPMILPLTTFVWHPF